MAIELNRIEAKEINVGRLLHDGDYEFEIPEYQRPYAWGVEQTMQLLSDLTDALDRDTEEPYFLGSIVLVKAPGNPRSEVIDGQQRLTTLTILLAIIRDLVQNPKLQEDIHKLIEKPEVSWDDDEPAVPRMRIRRRDHQFFNSFVQTRGGVEKLVDLSENSVDTDSQRGIRDNARALHQELSEWSEDQLKSLFKLIGKRSYVVVVSTPDLNSAYRIFSVMNSRGLPLSPQDIFKSQVIGAIPEHDKQDFADLWENLEESLGRDEFGDLFLYIRAIRSRTRAVKGLLQEFPEQVLNDYLPGNGKGFILEVLEPYAKADIRLRAQDLHGDDPRWDEVNAWLKRLDQLDNDDWRPAALWALTEHGDNVEFLVSFLAKLERLAASMLVRRVYATPRQQRYMELLKQLSDGSGLASSAFELSDLERSETLARLEGEIYLATRVRKYVLLRLDSVLAKDPGASYDHRIITVEHVLPQTPQVDSQWVQDFSEEEAAHWTHRLANLVLLNRRSNSRAQNFDFPVKKDKYFTSGDGVAVFALTTQVIGHDRWTPEVLEARQRYLADILANEWQLY